MLIITIILCLRIVGGVDVSYCITLLRTILHSPHKYPARRMSSVYFLVPLSPVSEVEGLVLPSTSETTSETVYNKIIKVRQIN